ncbi:MAG: hypothetical protein K0S53_632 [Bacteroidetes bacterium]|jgi:hypothetical protein|nr:hypothetical protein [Bacteroidota bacterium]MDF2451614.1 hypothetical protein [Bacteroidota bacterium]
MKTIFQKLLPVGVLLISSFCLKSQVNTVEINASALIEDKATDDYSIVVYSDGQLKDSIYNKKTKAVTLSLESNTLYSVVFKKANYPDKLVIVNTKIPTGLMELAEDPFELQIELTPNTTTLKKDLYDYPVAILQVNKKVKSLMASESYHKFTHN